MWLQWPHGIVGNLMDSHPNVVMASELDMFARSSDGSLPSEIFNALWVNIQKNIMYMQT